MLEGKGKVVSRRFSVVIQYVSKKQRPENKIKPASVMQFNGVVGYNQD